MISQKGTEFPTVIGADRFYMTNEALKNIEGKARFLWADSKSEDEFIKKARQTKSKVIISEYVKITGKILDASPMLKGVVVWGVGYDHIDVNAASERGIYVVNTRGSNAESVAEHVFTLILGLSRRLLGADAFVRKGEWVTREETGLPNELASHDIYQKTLGIVGFGFIGTLVARIAKGFDMRVLACDPYLTPEAIREKGAEPAALKTLLKESDFVTLHVVLTEETRRLISKDQLNLMKPTACLINASRGAVVDEPALIEALQNQKIAGAGLDVFVKEPVDLKNPLLKLGNVLVSPHCAGNSEEALKATSWMVAEETLRIVQDEVPRNLVNRTQLVEKGYVK